MFGFGKKETRSATFTQSETDVGLLQLLGINVSGSISLEQALQVPSVWGAINFIAGTVAGLPLQVFEKKVKGERKKVTKGVGDVLSNNINDSCSSFQWRYDMFSTGVLPNGRFVTYIERDGNGTVIDLYPIVGAKCEMLANGQKRYYQETNTGAKKLFAAKDVIDLTFMLKPDLVTARSPLSTCSSAIAKAYHANAYGAKLFENGGVSPYVLQGPFSSEKAAHRARVDVQSSIQKLSQEGGKILAMPLGHKLETIGGSPDSLQMVETQKFAVVEVARIFSLPPTFLQDLSNGTFSNTEQQDLQLVKHTIKRWCEQIEAEINLKVFGRGSKFYAEFNLDGLMRGDFMSTMQGNAIGIQSGQITPQETRDKRNLPIKDGADQLFIQGATTPILQQSIKPDGENDVSVGTNIVDIIDDYGKAVRAGTISPQIEDEEKIRMALGLPAMSSDAKALWGKQGNVRQPITLKSAEEAEALVDDVVDDSELEIEDDANVEE